MSPLDADATLLPPGLLAFVGGVGYDAAKLRSAPMTTILRPGPYLRLPIAALACLAIAGPTLGAEQKAAKTDTRPVILLTGFEPFGDKRPPNPSWESVKSLDGQDWRGYRLVARQLPVVWGAPRVHLEEWIAAYRPVAIFSFGQGGKGSFALETHAVNTRCSIWKGAPVLDNLGDCPTTPTILAGGPEFVYATLPSSAMVKSLKRKGYPMRVSKNAGQYLCEETLYTLETLRAAGKIDGPVAFCHVPPLGTYANKNLVTAEYVRDFMRDVLEAWHGIDGTQPVAFVAEQNEGRPGDDPRQPEVREFVNRYFRTWSNQDMKGYDECFMSDATIQFLDSRGLLDTSSRRQFVAGQAEYHRTAQHRATEVPESIDIRFEGKLARAVVYWKLTAGPRIEYGYDHFTLLKQDGQWRIVNLVFYQVPRK